MDEAVGDIDRRAGETPVTFRRFPQGPAANLEDHAHGYRFVETRQYRLQPAAARAISATFPI
jgi:hypothetical protein